jgi:hypothetical protein
MSCCTPDEPSGSPSAYPTWVTPPQIHSGTVMEGRIAVCHELAAHVAPSIHRASQQVLEAAERTPSNNDGKPPSSSRNVLFGG